MAGNKDGMVQKLAENGYRRIFNKKSSAKSIDPRLNFSLSLKLSAYQWTILHHDLVGCLTKFILWIYN